MAGVICKDFDIKFACGCSKNCFTHNVLGFTSYEGTHADLWFELGENLWKKYVTSDRSYMVHGRPHEFSWQAMSSCIEAQNMQHASLVPRPNLSREKRVRGTWAEFSGFRWTFSCANQIAGLRCNLITSLLNHTILHTYCHAMSCFEVNDSWNVVP